MVGGIVLIIVGTLFLLQQFDVTRFGRLWDYWPLILVALGVARILDPVENERRGSGYWLLAIGTWLLIGSLELFGFSYGTSWPLLLVMFGIIIIGQAVFERPRIGSTEPRNEVNGR
jgi:hypothetical protein